jgi:hypothetical protein
MRAPEDLGAVYVAKLAIAYCLLPIARSIINRGGCLARTTLDGDDCPLFVILSNALWKDCHL